jgi:hypothetical protein
MLVTTYTARCSAAAIVLQRFQQWLQAQLLLLTTVLDMAVH